MYTEVMDRPLPIFGWLAMIQGPLPGQSWRLKEKFTIGRGHNNDIALLNNSSISTEHVLIRLESRQFVLYDMGSLNGTQVNDKRVERAVLIDGDHIRIGNVEFVFKKV